MPSGKAAKASSVGAKTVKGPSPDNASTKPAASRAATRVVKLPASTATSTIVPETMVSDSAVSAWATILDLAQS